MLGTYLITWTDVNGTSGTDTVKNIAEVDYANVSIPLVGSIFGTKASDNLVGTSSSDVFIASTGGDTYDGNGGYDKLVYVNNLSVEITSSSVPGAYQIKWQNIDGTSGIDTIRNISEVDWAQGKIYLNPTPLKPQIILTENFQTFETGHYSALNNDWGTPFSLRNQPGSSSTIIINKNEFPNNTLIQWSFPNYWPGTVWGYPEVLWGSQYSNNNLELSTPVGNIQHLLVSYSINFDTNNPISELNQVFFEIFTKNASGELTNEIGVIILSGGYNPGPTTRYSDNYITANLQIHHDAGAPTWIGFTLTTDMLNGTLDYGSLLSYLVAQGIISPADSVSGLELGTEMHGGSGVMFVNNFSVFETLSIAHTINYIGSLPGQIFDIDTNNNYLIDGALNSASDTVRIGSAVSNFSINRNYNGHFSLSAKFYGNIDITNISLLKFSDVTLDTTSFTKTAALQHSQIASLVQLYVASFNRAPDSVGLYYWGSRLSDGMSLQDIANSFFVQPETVAAYPTTMATSDFVTRVYNNVLSRAPDTGGLKYWVSELDTGKISKDSFLLAIINGAQASTGSAIDRQTLANKETVGEHYAIFDGLNNSSLWAKDVMSGVTDQLSTITSANAKADAYALTAANPLTSDLMVKLVGIAV